jgi:hypothetical protein
LLETERYCDRHAQQFVKMRSQFLLEIERYCDRHAQQFALSQEIELTPDDSEDLLKDKFNEYPCIVERHLKIDWFN